MLIYNSQISVKEYNRIRLAVGWKELDEEQARIGLENSAYLTVAWDDSESRGETKSVGMARVISDGGYMALIVDVMVLPEYQGKGVGRRLMENITEWLDQLTKDGRCVMINLMATPGNESFYEKFGFVARPNDHMGAGMVRWINE